MNNSNFFQNCLPYLIVSMSLVVVSCNKKTTIQTNKDLPYQLIENKNIDSQLIYSDTSSGTLKFNTNGSGFQKNSWSKEPTPIAWRIQDGGIKIKFDEEDIFSFQVMEKDSYIKKLKQVRSYTKGGQSQQYESILLLN